MSKVKMSHARRSRSAFAVVASLGFGASVEAAVVINEVVYDDGGTDDREYVELYNNGAAPVDVSNWVVRNADTVAAPGDNNADFTIPAGTSIPAGGFYVIGQTNVLNVNFVVPAASTLENDNESMQLLDGTGAVQDSLVYELRAGPVAASPAEGGIFGNMATSDLPGTTNLNVTQSFGRFVDGRDTGNNGRDFGVRPSTPGTSNNTGLMTLYTPPNPSGQTVGSDVPGVSGSFVTARYINPTVADANNPNVIPDNTITPGRAIVAWDSSGGGNGVTSNQVFGTTQGGFAITAFLDTSDQPQNSNAAGVLFRGSELTIYGIGSGDMNGTGVSNLTDLTGKVGLSAGTLPAADNANATTGVAWVYEKTAVDGATQPTQTLYLVDANDGGDSTAGGNTPLDWTILQTIDLGAVASDWFDLSIVVDPLGNGVATFDGQVFNFTTSTAMNSGAFNVQYRENLQLAADATPDAIMRPPTFTIVPEPGTLSLLALGGLGLLARRRRA